MANEIVGYKPFPVQLPKWEIDVTIVRTDDGHASFAVRHVCQGLGLTVQSQLTALQADERYADALYTFRIPTERRAASKTWCACAGVRPPGGSPTSTPRRSRPASAMTWRSSRPPSWLRPTGSPLAISPASCPRSSHTRPSAAS